MVLCCNTRKLHRILFSLIMHYCTCTHTHHTHTARTHYTHTRMHVHTPYTHTHTHTHTLHTHALHTHTHTHTHAHTTQRRLIALFNDITEISYQPDICARGKLCILTHLADHPLIIRTGQLTDAMNMATLLDGYCKSFTPNKSSRLRNPSVSSGGGEGMTSTYIDLAVGFFASCG